MKYNTSTSTRPDSYAKADTLTTSTVNFARIVPLFSPNPETRLIFTPPRRGNAALQLRSTRSLALAPLQSLPAKTFSVEKVKGTFSPVAGTSNLKPLGAEELSLPPGMPRFVNAATLKKMLKAKPSSLLLKRIGEQWEVVENSRRIDLLDDSVEFRLGAVQIYS